METSAYFSDIFYLFAGVPITFFSWIIFGFIQKYCFLRKTRILNKNLANINKKWSHELDDIVDFDKQEKISFFSQCIILGIASSVFSWLGFLASTFVWIGFYFIKSRKEQKVLNSELARVDGLSSTEIDKFFENWR